MTIITVGIAYVFKLKIVGEGRDGPSNVDYFPVSLQSEPYKVHKLHSAHFIFPHSRYIITCKTDHCL